MCEIRLRFDIRHSGRSPSNATIQATPRCNKLFLYYASSPQANINDVAHYGHVVGKHLCTFAPPTFAPLHATGSAASLFAPGRSGSMVDELVNCGGICTMGAGRSQGSVSAEDPTGLARTAAWPTGRVSQGAVIRRTGIHDRIALSRYGFVDELRAI